MNKMEAFVSEQLKKEVPQFNIGDTVKVHNLIKEGTRERIQSLILNKYEEAMKEDSFDEAE